MNGQPAPAAGEEHLHSAARALERILNARDDGNTYTATVLPRDEDDGQPLAPSQDPADTTSTTT